MSVSIDITADDVRLDLNDYEVVGHASHLYGVRVSSGASRVSIYNGIVSMSGGSGVEVQANSSSVCIAQVRANGCSNGFWIHGTDSGNKVSDCSVVSCDAVSCTTAGFFMQYTDRTVVRQCGVTQSVQGFRVINECKYNVFTDCRSVDLTSGGPCFGFSFDSGTGNLVQRYVAKKISGGLSSFGISSNNENELKVIDCIVNGVVGTGLTPTGLQIVSSSGCLSRGNKIYNCDTGLLNDSAANLFIQNVAYNNSASNYTGVSNKQNYDPLVGGTTTVYDNVAIPS